MIQTNALSTRGSAWRLFIACLISTAVVAGCGVGFGTDGSAISAGVGSGGTGVFKASLSGAVTDGYLINAIIFMDKNGNYQLDSEEPYAVTGVDGVSKLEVATADIGAYPIVAVALRGITIDSSTMQAVVSNYVLSFPKESFNNSESNIISPLSSQLRELLETGKYVTVRQAMNALADHMGLPSDIDLLAENIAADNPTLNAAAKSIAAIMWMQTGQILVSGAATPAVDVDRYRTMMKLIADNMLIVSRMNSPENLINLNNNISVVLDGMPHKSIVP